MMNIMLLSIFSFFSLFCGNTNERVDIQMVNKHSKNFATKMKQKDLYVYGTGGRMMSNIKSIALDFDAQKKVEVAEARQMIVEMTEEFLAEINSDQKLKPYLDNYPFIHKNTELSISFKDKNRIYLQESVALVNIYGDNIIYSVSIGRKSPLITIYREPYLEALQKVKQGDNSSITIDKECIEKAIENEKRDRSQSHPDVKIMEFY